MQLIISLIAFITMLFSFSSYAADAKHGIICKGQYVICTSAPCVQIPGVKNKALCSCGVEQGVSFGFSKCSERTPKFGANRETTILSTYSFAQANTKAVSICPAGTAWTNCLDKPCIINPENPNKANCTCDIIRKGKYVTFGGNCNVKNCGKTMWSGATLESFQKASKQLMKMMGIKKKPTQLCKPL